MRKKIYNAVVERLRAAEPDIRFTSLWNNDTEKLTDQVTFELPAVFVEFEPIEWSQQHSGVRSADLRVRLHIVTSPHTGLEEGSQYPDIALEHLDFIERISASMQGLSGEGFNRFMLVESLTDHNHILVSDNQECYITHITDTSAQKVQYGITGVKPVRVETKSSQG